MVTQLVSHPLVGCLEQLRAVLAEASGFEPTYLSDDDKRTVLLGVGEAERRLAGLKLKTMAASSDLAEADGARDVAAWLAHRTHAEPRPLRAEQRLASAIDQKWSKVAEGMAAGLVSTEQAQVIVAGLEALPAHVGAEIIAKAEAQLVELARDHNPTELRILARRILDLVAPEIAEGEEAKRLEDEEQRSRETCRLSFKAMGDGSTRITGQIPDEAAQRLQTYLHAYTSPRKQHEAIGGEEDRIPYRRQLAQAFCSLLEHLDPDQLPEHGGDATSLLVTISLDALQTELGSGAIIGGSPMSATAVRRLACEAGIIPVVLGGTGEILDLGRTRRLYTPAQRKALALRDQQCSGEGCSVPARWCEAHHDKPWSQGGNTDLNHGRLYCNYHHHRAHDPRYTHEILPSGDIRFTRR